MPVILVLGYALSLACGVHVVRSGRELYWIILLIMAPYLGAAIYVLAVIMPEQATYNRRRGAVRMAKRAINPEGSLRDAKALADLSPTAANSKAVGDELMARGRYAEAVAAYDDALSSPIHATDPAFMASKAHALLMMGEPGATIKVLDALREANPGWRNAYAHLDYAQALEAKGEADRALEEYAAVAVYYPGEEARVRLALLLKKAGRSDDANVIWREIRASERAAGPIYRKQQREWLDVARENDPDRSR